MLDDAGEGYMDGGCKCTQGKWMQLRLNDFQGSSSHPVASHSGLPVTLASP